MSKTEKKETQESGSEEKAVKKCGIVMPISSIDGCDEKHWQEVLDIVKEAISSAGFDGELVSLSADVGVIHRRIVQNLYENPIVVCDVSGKNPNVMFELGLRLAFDKPTIIIKDDETNYSFDTSPIEHLEYPRSLRFSQIIDFKQQLAEKITATYEKSIQDSGYSPFLKHFGSFKVADLGDREVSANEFLINEVSDLKRFIMHQYDINNRVVQRLAKSNLQKSSRIRKVVFDDKLAAKRFVDSIKGHNGVEEASLEFAGGDILVSIKYSSALSESEFDKLKDEIISVS